MMDKTVFALVGGDERFCRLAELLRQDGHQVNTCALGANSTCDSVELAARGARYAILPLPAANGAMLNTPLGESVTFARALSALAGCRGIYAGKLSCREWDTALSVGANVHDYFLREELLVANAALTAEGAISMAMTQWPDSLLGSRILVLGYGRIGSALCRRLSSFGARVCAAARRPEQRMLARCDGVQATDFEGAAYGQADAIFNTVPAAVLTGERLKLLKKDALVIDVATKPGGVDWHQAELLGVNAVLAPGLPGKSCPVSAARIIRDTVCRMIEEGDLNG